MLVKAQILLTLPVNPSLRIEVIKLSVFTTDRAWLSVNAAMYVYGVTDLITFNTDDFTRYTEIAVHHPTVVTL